MGCDIPTCGVANEPGPSKIDPELVRVEMVGLSGLEPLTSRLSGERSNQLSYRPGIRRARMQLAWKK